MLPPGRLLLLAALLALLLTVIIRSSAGPVSPLILSSLRILALFLVLTLALALILVLGLILALALVLTLTLILSVTLLPVSLSAFLVLTVALLLTAVSSAAVPVTPVTTVLSVAAVLSVTAVLSVAAVLSVTAISSVSSSAVTALSAPLGILAGAVSSATLLLRPLLRCLITVHQFGQLGIQQRFIRVELPSPGSGDQLCHTVFHDLLIIIIIRHIDLYSLTEHIYGCNISRYAIIGGNAIPHIGELGIQIFIGVLLMLQAAHQTSAHTGDLRGVQGQTLLLRHLDGYRYKVRQIGMTAELSAADPDTAAHF